MRNDDCHTALDVARIKGHTNVVRAIEVLDQLENCKYTNYIFGY